MSGQFIRFVIVGAVCTIINYAVFFSLHSLLQVNYTLASAIGYCVGLVFGYLLNRNWTFKLQRSEQDRHKEMIAYLVVYTITLLISLAFLRLLVEWLQVNVLLANFFTIGLSTICNFTGLKLVVFKGFKQS